MKVLVTGGAGYIGSILIRKLMKLGHDVRIMESFKFGLDPIKDVLSDFNTIIGDIREPDRVNDALKDIDAVIHLAAIVGDPACAVNAELATEVNYLSTLRLALAAKNKGIKKFIFSSTCSVYGASISLSEDGNLNPQSFYAETKLLAEKAIRDLKNEDFKPIIFRLGTLYGISPRLRFDLVINSLTGKLMKENKCMIFGGDQWRPFIHVDDVAEAFVFGITNYDKMNGAYNIGSNKENYQMNDIGKIFEKIFPKANIQYVEEMKDKRTYNVNFDKIEKLGFKLKRKIPESIKELKDYIRVHDIDVNDLKYYNYHP